MRFMYFHQFRINCIFIILELFCRRYFVKYDRVFVQDYDELMYEAIGLGRGPFRDVVVNSLAALLRRMTRTFIFLVLYL